MAFIQFLIAITGNFYLDERGNFNLAPTFLYFWFVFYLKM